MNWVEKLKLDRLRNKPIVVALLIVALTVLSVGFVSTALLSGHSGKDARFGQGMHHRGFGGIGEMHGMPPAGEFRGMPPQRRARMMPPQFGEDGFAQRGFDARESGMQSAGQGSGLIPQLPDNQTMQQPFGQAQPA